MKRPPVPPCTFCNKKNKSGKSMPGMPFVRPHCQNSYAATLCGVERVSVVWSFLDKQRAS